MLDGSPHAGRMTEAERYQKRKDYYRTYAAINAAKRAAAGRRWREKQKQIRASAKAAAPIAKVTISVPRDIVGLSARFSAYRAARKEAQP